MYTDRQGKVRKAIYFNNEDWEKIEKKAALCKLNTTRYILLMLPHNVQQ